MKITLIGFVSLLLLGNFSAFAGESVEYRVDGGVYEGYWTKVDDNAPLVILVHDWDGLTEYEQKRADMLNHMGYNVFAVDLFGKGIRPTKVEDKRQHTGELYKDRHKLRKLMNGGIQVAEELGGNVDNMVVMGYCFGGAAVLESARNGIEARGFVTFHGGLKTPVGQSHSHTKAPIMILHGTADTAIPMSDFAQLANELEENKVPHSMITYGGAPHAFTVWGSERYRQDADQKSWQEFSNFLKANTKRM